MPLPRELSKSEKATVKKIMDLLPKAMTFNRTPQGEQYWLQVYDNLGICLGFGLSEEVDEDDTEVQVAPAPAPGLYGAPMDGIPFWQQQINAQLGHLHANYANHHNATVGAGVGQVDIQPMEWGNFVVAGHDPWNP